MSDIAGDAAAAAFQFGAMATTGTSLDPWVSYGAILAPVVADVLERVLSPRQRSRVQRLGSLADKAVIARIKGGEDFAKVATELSKDPSADGGDLGWFTKDRMVPEFSDAAFKLKKGEVSDPVKTQFGWHIIKIEDVRTKSFPPFEQVKEQAARYVSQKAESEAIAQLHSAAKIELFDADGKPVAAQSEAAPDAQGKGASPGADKPKTP